MVFEGIQHKEGIFGEEIITHGLHIVPEQYEALKKREVCPRGRPAQQFPSCAEKCRYLCAVPLAHR